jgi:hypothetical protein
MIHVLEKLHAFVQNTADTDQFLPPLCIAIVVLHNDFKSQSIPLKWKKDYVGMQTHVSQTNT